MNIKMVFLALLESSWNRQLTECERCVLWDMSADQIVRLFPEGK